MHRTACCVVLMVSVAACSHPSSVTYGDTEVGQAIETAPGSVVSSRTVNVSGEPGLVGASAAAAVGAAGGSLTVSGPAGLLVAIVGGLVAAGVGYLAEKQMKDRDGIEYVLEMDDGRLVTLVQNREDDEQPLPNGTPVLVQLAGQYTRVMAHPAAVDHDVGGGWVDPDAANPPAAGPGAASPDAAPSARDLLFQGSGAVPRPGDPDPTATGSTSGRPAAVGSGQKEEAGRSRPKGRAIWWCWSVDRRAVDHQLLPVEPCILRQRFIAARANLIRPIVADVPPQAGAAGNQILDPAIGTVDPLGRGAGG